MILYTRLVGCDVLNPKDKVIMPTKPITMKHSLDSINKQEHFYEGIHKQE